MNSLSIILFKDKKLCCGCGACMNICGKHAISMCLDEYGFVYPKIDSTLCVKCGLCKKVCRYKTDGTRYEVREAYAAAAKDNGLIMRSASGGIFAVLARTIIEKNGVVYGAAMPTKGYALDPKHIRIEKADDIITMQGSKYVQSSIGKTYIEAERDLREGRTVLFSGTPCQIDGLKGFLGQDYEDLITVDIICHGVPSSKMFNDYIAVCMNKYKGRIAEYRFRDKKKGWGLNARLIYQNYNGKIKSKLIPSGASSYFDMFLKGEIYRDSCYSCPYAGGGRVGDLTLGDFWGIQRQHPELMLENGGCYDEKRGISCVLVNTERGKSLICEISDKIEYHKSDIEKISSENGQLKYPSKCPDTRDYILSLYRDKGWQAVESYFNKRNGLRTYYYYLKNMLPRSVKKQIKKYLKK